MGTAEDADAVAPKRPQVSEGGRWRFAVVFASFSINFLVMAMTRCTGVLFISFQNAFMITVAQTGAISSTMSATALFGASFGGVLGNHFGWRRAAMFGGVLNIVGLVGSSLTNNIYQMYVVGALAGFGSGIAFTPAVVMNALYFKKNYTWANAFMTTGDSIGLLVFAPVMQLLLDTYGWRGTVLVTGAITANVCAAAAVYRPIRPSRAVRKRLHKTTPDEESAEKDDDGMSAKSTRTAGCRSSWTVSITGCFAGIVKLMRLNLLRQSYRFAAFCVSKTTYLIAYGCFLIYLIPYANSVGIHDQKAAFLISIAGISSIPGRPLCGLINQRVSSVIIYQASMLVCGCAVLVAAQGPSYPYLAVSAAILGFAVGFQHTIETVMLREFVGVDNLGSAVGIFSGFGGAADLIGPILAGALYDATKSFSLLFYVFAGIFFLGFLAILSEPLLRRIEPGVYKAVKTDDPRA